MAERPCDVDFAIVVDAVWFAAKVLRVACTLRDKPSSLATLPRSALAS